MSEPSTLPPADLDRQHPLLERLLEALDQGALELPPLPVGWRDLFELAPRLDVAFTRAKRRRQARAQLAAPQ